MRHILSTLLLCVCAALAAGCGGDPAEPGVVARVNGRPITLAQLEFMSDLMHINQQTDYTPSLEQLKAQHGQALADLIVQQLIEQELEARGMEVTENELAVAEETVRADYPEGVFEEMLVEEYIDINAWRAQLKARLAMEKLANLVLRPRIRLDHQEAEKFYKDHAQDFYLPPRLSLILVTGPGKDLVDKAVDTLQKGASPEEIAQRLNAVTARRVKLREDRLPSTWREALKAVGKDGVSPLWTDKGGVSRIIVLENIPGKLLDVSQAYPLVERILLEAKMAEEFDAWLGESVGKAQIKVNAQLLRESKDEAEADSGGAGREEASGTTAAGRPGEDDPVGGAPAEDMTGKVRPSAAATAPAAPAPDVGKAEEPKLLPDLAPQDVAPREIIEQERGRYYPSPEAGEEQPQVQRLGRRDKNRQPKQGITQE